jgi:putative transposase
MAEVDALSRAVSPSANRPYGVARVTKTLGIARSSFYDWRDRQGPAASVKPLEKRGPKTKHTDAELTDHIRKVLADSPFVGEGHRKAWARLRHVGIRTSKARVLRLMRVASLLAAPTGRRVLGPRIHDGKITTELPDVMWGTDGTSTFTTTDGPATVFAAVDHATGECVGIHAAKRGTRFEALDPIYQAVRARFNGFGPGIAKGLQVRHDHGSQYMSGTFQKELAFLGITSSPSFVRAPEGNGVAERFFRTLKEQCLWLTPYATVEELRLALHAWVKVYNESWLVARHGYRAPAQVRRDLLAQAAVA